MGIVTCEHEASINHFSHSHPLQLSNFQDHQQNHQLTCSACKQKLSDSIYSCTSCNFFLHAKCSRMPKKITHPYHKEHALNLFSKSPYLSGSFVCDACGKTGDGFVYNCKRCERDIHILCAVLPMSRFHNSHPHELKLTFDIASFHCDICRERGQNQWLYWCRGCNFAVHSCCANRCPVNSLSRSEPQPQPFVGMNSMNPGPVNLALNHGAHQGQFMTPNLMNPGFGAHQGHYMAPNLMNPGFGAHQGHYMAPNLSNPGFGAHQGHYVAPNLLDPGLGQIPLNQVPQPGYFIQPGVASLEEQQRMILQQAILQLRGDQNSMQNRAAIDMLQSMLNGGGNGIGSGVTQSVLQGFGGGGGGGGGGELNMLQGLLGGGGIGIPGLDIGGLGNLLGGLGGFF